MGDRLQSLRAEEEAGEERVGVVEEAVHHGPQPHLLTSPQVSQGMARGHLTGHVAAMSKGRCQLLSVQHDFQVGVMCRVVRACDRWGKWKMIIRVSLHVLRPVKYTCEGVLCNRFRCGLIIMLWMW